ncbi:MAG TPA: hypothetical protein DEB06_08805 [Phycisphaerales bacterium]|nr:hypothetical protein [Phycisphaerales bacterium]
MAKKSMDTLSISDMQKEIRRRERMVSGHVKKLARRRDKLRGQLLEVETELAKFGAAAGRAGRAARSGAAGGRKRPKNDANLADALAGVLKNATMSVTEVAAEVQRAGYQTTSPNFRTIVNQTLIKDSRFKRVGRGQYTVK